VVIYKTYKTYESIPGARPPPLPAPNQGKDAIPIFDDDNNKDVVDKDDAAIMI
jgi:hypothetical protein